MKIPGVPIKHLAQDGDAFAALTTQQVEQVVHDVAAALPRYPTVDDLSGIYAAWADRVQTVLIPEVNRLYWTGVNWVTLPIVRKVEQMQAQLAAGIFPDVPLDDWTVELPKRYQGLAVQLGRVANPVAEQYMADATNRLVNVGNDVWETVRGQLVWGMQHGEGVRELRDRVWLASSLARPRAEVIARTEANGASNGGAMDQMRGYGLPGVMKGWLSTHDSRTRHWHSAVSREPIPLDQPFIVGGEYMDRPHAPGASARNVVNCRCTITFDVPDDNFEQLELFHMEPTTRPSQILTDPSVELPFGSNARYDTRAAQIKPKDLTVDLEEMHADGDIIGAVDDIQWRAAQKYGLSFAHVEDAFLATYQPGIIAYVTAGNFKPLTLGVNTIWEADALRLLQGRGEIAVGAWKGSITHELAHALFDKYGAPGHEMLGLWQRSGAVRDAAMKSAAAAARATGAPPRRVLGSTLSKYAGSSKQEATAELFSFYHWGGDARPPWVVTWGKTLHEALGLDPTPFSEMEPL